MVVALYPLVHRTRPHACGAMRHSARLFDLDCYERVKATKPLQVHGIDTGVARQMPMISAT
jgi:hypothetical protein